MYLVHQLPCLLDGLPVDLEPGRRYGGGEGSVQPRQEVVGEVSLTGRHPGQGDLRETALNQPEPSFTLTRSPPTLQISISHCTVHCSPHPLGF